MGSGSLKTQVTDPLADQKFSAANTSLGDYQSLQSSLPALQNYFNSNFGNTSGSNINPLLNATNQSVLGDISGQGGPYTSLKQNLLGAFDTGAQKNVIAPLTQQLVNSGLYGSGVGMDVLGSKGADLAQQRATLGSQEDVDLLNMANQLGQQQFNMGQTLGFTDPMQAISAYQQLMQPPQFQNIESQTYNQPSAMSQYAPLIGAAGGAALGSMAGNPIMGAQIGSSLGSAVGGSGQQTPMPQMSYYQQAPQLGNYQTPAFNPGPANYYQPLSLPAGS